MVSMSEQGGAARRVGRAPMPSRNRRRWQIVAGVVVLWIILWLVPGSGLGAIIFLLVIAALIAAAVFGLRALGVTRDHPWMQRISSRPWRDGQDVLQQAMRHFPEVFVTTPSGTLLAPDVVDLRMNPDDLAVLGERMEPAVVMESAAEVYTEQVQQHRARLAGRVRPEVRIIADPSILPGRFRLKQGQPVNPYANNDVPEPAPAQAQAPAPAPAPAELRQAPAPDAPDSQYPRPHLVPDHGTNDGYTQAQPGPAGAVSGFPTVLGRDHHAAPPDHRGKGGRDHRVRGPGRPRPLGRAGSARGAHGVPRARQVHLLRRPVVRHQPGHERDHRERPPGQRRAAGHHRRLDPLGYPAGRAAVRGPDRLIR